MKKVIAVFLSILLFAAAVACGSSNTATETKPADPGTAQQPQAAPAKTVKFSIGASSVGGGFYNGASAISTVVNSMLPGYECTVEVTGASAANAMLTQAKDIQMAMCATEVMYEAYNGIGDFTGQQACPDIRAVMPGWGGIYMFITLASSNINSVYDLEGVNFSGGPVGSSNQILVNRVLEVCGVKVDMSNLPNSDASRALGDGTIKGFALAHPAAAVSELEATNTLKILTIPDDKVDAFKAAYPQYVWLTIPGGYYKCLPEDTYNVGLYNMVIANVATDDELIYQVVKACYENQDLIKSIFAQFGNEMSIENIGYSTIPYHAGAVRYFKEIGADVPAELIPPEYKG